jgi:hypothetical protein
MIGIIKKNPIFDSGRNHDFDRDFGKTRTDKNLNRITKANIISISNKNYEQ